MKLLMRAWMRLTKRDRRRSSRHNPPLVAFYWNGGGPLPYHVENISLSGASILTPEPWAIGTMLCVRLQETASPEHVSNERKPTAVSVFAIVVSRAGEGMGMTFVFSNRKERKQFEHYLNTVLHPPAGERRPVSKLVSAPAGNGPKAGSSLVEFALLLPMLFLLMVNVVNFGSFFFAWITMANAARTAAQYEIMAGVTVTSPRPASSTQIYNVVVSDISSLMNRSSLAVRVCTKNGATITCNTTGTGTFTNPPADASTEASSYVMAWVDVLYTYQPVIPLFDFPGLGVHATLPTTTIHRQAVMRMLQ